MPISFSGPQHHIRLQISISLLKLLLLIRSCSKLPGEDKDIRSASDCARALDKDLKAAKFAQTQDELWKDLEQGQADMRKADDSIKALVSHVQAGSEWWAEILPEQKQAKDNDRANSRPASTTASVQAFIRTPQGLRPAPFPSTSSSSFASGAPVSAATSTSVHPLLITDGNDDASPGWHTSTLSPRQQAKYGITQSQHAEMQAAVWQQVIAAVQMQVASKGFMVVHGGADGGYVSGLDEEYGSGQDGGYGGYDSGFDSEDDF